MAPRVPARRSVGLVAIALGAIVAAGGSVAAATPTPVLPARPARPPHPGPRRPPGLVGQVLSLASGRLTLEMPGPHEQVVDLSTATTYRFGPGYPATVGALRVGETVMVQGPQSNGVIQAHRVTLRLSSVTGRVTAVHRAGSAGSSSGSLTTVSILEANQRTATIVTATPSSLAVGETARGFGWWHADTLTALGLFRVPRHVDGIVTALSADTATVREPNGSVVTVRWTAQTVFRAGPQHAVASTALRVGERINAQGFGQQGALVATRIDMPPAPPPQ